MRGGLIAALVAAMAGAALADSVGGGFWPATGTGRVSIRRSGVRPFGIPSNLRFDFDGGPGDLSGTGTVLAYDDLGQTLLAQFPFTWTGRRNGPFQADLDAGAFADFLQGRVAAAAGKEAAVTLTSVRVRGAPSRDRGDLRASVKAVGGAALAGGPELRLSATMRLR